MTPLMLLLASKIVVTFAAVSLPFLFFSKARIDGILQIEGASGGLYKLYGMAVTALLVGYGGGMFEAAAGRFPTGVVAMGIVSNLGATLMLFLSGMFATQRVLTVFFGLVAAALVWTALFPEASMVPIM